MRLIAIEEHILPSYVRDAWAAAPPPHEPVSAIADGGETGERLAEIGEMRLALMDEQGVDVQVLSLTTAGLHNLGPAPAVEAAQRVNDQIAAACARHPGRFQGFAALPTPDPDAAPRELERAVCELGLKGALLCGRTRERHLDHHALRPTFGHGGTSGGALVHPSPDPAAGGARGDSGPARGARRARCFGIVTDE